MSPKAQLHHTPLDAKTLREAVEAHQRYIAGRSGGRRLSLTYADLSNCALEGVDLREADFAGANFTGASLSRANLAGAILFGADLTAAGGLWRRPTATAKRWTYRDMDPTTPPGAPGVAAASLAERPAASGNFVFKMVGKKGTINSGYTGAGLAVRLEIGPSTGGVCVADTLGTCSSVSMHRDLCRNP